MKTLKWLVAVMLSFGLSNLVAFGEELNALLKISPRDGYVGEAVIYTVEPTGGTGQYQNYWSTDSEGSQNHLGFGLSFTNVYSSSGWKEVEMGLSSMSNGYVIERMERKISSFVYNSRDTAITVLSPKVGDVWEVGKTYEIRWASTGSAKKVQIGLWDPRFNSEIGNAGLETIAFSVDNNGSFFYTVPLPNTNGISKGDIGGTNYFISVVPWDGGLAGFSEGKFAIIKSLTPARISEFAILSVERARLSADVIPGLHYRVEASTNLVDWQPTRTSIIATSSVMVIEMEIDLVKEPMVFFRLAEIHPIQFSVSTDASSPAYQVVAAGSVGVVTTVAKFRALYEPVILTRVALQLSSGTPRDIVQATIWDGTTQVGVTQFIGTNKQAVVSLWSPVLVPKDTDKTLTIKVDFENICALCVVTNSGSLVKIDINTSQEVAGQETRGIGTLSGEYIKASGQALSGGVRVFKSYPTFALDPLPSTGVADGRLLRFKVTANVGGSIGLSKFAFSVFSSSATLNSIALFAYSDPQYSQPAMNGSALMVSGPDSDIVLAYPQNDGGVRLQLPAGATYYFELRGAIIGDETSYSVSTSLLGDKFYVGGVDIIPFSELSSQNCVWSPNSLWISSFNDPDWFNSYGLPGLPSTGLSQTRTE